MAGTRGITTLTNDGACAVIDIDDGTVNVLSTPVLRDIGAGLGEAAGTARVTVIRGRPGIFSAGFDLRTFQSGRAASRAMLEAGVDLIVRILDHPHPVVTVCTGHAYPMGAFLMLAADVRLGVAGEWRIGLNEVAIRMPVPDFALALARYRLTPPGFALVATGTMLAPTDAASAGYLDIVAPAHELDHRTREVVARLEQVDPDAYVNTKARMLGDLRAAVLGGIPG